MSEDLDSIDNSSCNEETHEGWDEVISDDHPDLIWDDRPDIIWDDDTPRDASECDREILTLQEPWEEHRTDDEADDGPNLAELQPERGGYRELSSDGLLQLDETDSPAVTDGSSDRALDDLALEETSESSVMPDISEETATPQLNEDTAPDINEEKTPDLIEDDIMPGPQDVPDSMEDTPVPEEDVLTLNEDDEKLDEQLSAFDSDNWQNASLEEKRDAMENLSGQVQSMLNLSAPPKLEFYSNPSPTDFGGFSYETNTLAVNEYMLADNVEAVDTIAHELWHAHQFERSSDPLDPKGAEYREGFENYRPASIDYDAYREQMVEVEARAFAQQFKDRLTLKGGNING